MPIRDYPDPDAAPAADDGLPQVRGATYLQVGVIPAQGNDQVTVAVAGEIDNETAPLL